MSVFLKTLALKGRELAPRGLKRFYRATRVAAAPSPVSKWLPQSLLDGCQLVSSRNELIARLPRGATVAELGTLKGDFARVIVKQSRPKKLHIIDLSFSAFDSTDLPEDIVERHLGPTVGTLAKFPDAHFDWIYVDADHSYVGVSADARTAAAKLRPGGYLVFNDFAHSDSELGQYGVHRAVIDFALENRWPMRYFALHPAALYDVALQKPDP